MTLPTTRKGKEWTHMEYRTARPVPKTLPSQKIQNPNDSYTREYKGQLQQYAENFLTRLGFTLYNTQNFAMNCGNGIISRPDYLLAGPGGYQMWIECHCGDEDPVERAESLKRWGYEQANAHGMLAGNKQNAMLSVSQMTNAPVLVILPDGLFYMILPTGDVIWKNACCIAWCPECGRFHFTPVFALRYPCPICGSMNARKQVWYGDGTGTGCLSIDGNNRYTPYTYRHFWQDMIESTYTIPQPGEFYDTTQYLHFRDGYGTPASPQIITQIIGGACPIVQPK